MKCGAVVKFCLWKLLLEGEHFNRQVVFCMSSGEQDKRHYGYSLFAGLDGRSYRIIDGWARELQESVLDEPRAGPLPDPIYEVFELSNAFGVLATVPGDNNTVFFCR